MNTKSLNFKTFLTNTAAALVVFCGILNIPVQAQSEERERVLNIKENVVAKDDVIRLHEFVVNTAMLTEEEREYEITDAPKNGQSVLSIVDLAYLFQKYNTLMDSKLRGPRNITLKRVKTSEYLDKARKEIINYVKSCPPWNEWEIDVLFNSTDELLITRAGQFDHLEVKSHETRGLLGTVAFSVTFFDKDKKQIDKSNISPVILRKIEVLVINSTVKMGERIKRDDFKKIPTWIGSEKKDYITDENKCLGYELARNVSGGEMLKSGDLLRPICAKKGDIVWVECNMGALTVRTPVTVLENGREGDVVKAVNNSSNKPISVELIKEKEAVYKL